MKGAEKVGVMLAEVAEMQDIIIDEQFKFLLPALDEKTYRDLEANILEFGCLFPLVLWNKTLIDGYNRYKICNEHNIQFDTIDMEFNNREEVEIWIIENQIARRNLTPIQVSYYRGVHYNTSKRIVVLNKELVQNHEKLQNATLIPGSTSKRLAEQYKVSRDTIIRDSKLATGLTSIGVISPDIKTKILSGDIRIGKNRLEALSDASQDEIEALVKEIEAGEFVSRVSRNSGKTKPDFDSDSTFPELRQLSNVITDFANNFKSMFEQLNSGNPAELKPVLRSYIDQLEELYQSLEQ